MATNRLLNLKPVMFLLFITGSAFAEEKLPMDRELDKIWGLDKSMEVVKEDPFLKEGMHEIALQSGLVPNDSYYSFFPLALRYSYFFTESLGIELNGQYLIGIDSDLKNFLDDMEFFRTRDPEKLVWSGGADFIFMPFRGKLSIMSAKLFHFDVGFFLGGGGLGLSVVENGNKTSKTTGYGEFGLGMRMYMNKNFSLRLDYRNMLYPRNEGGIGMPVFLTVGAGYIIK
jgi:outer membrane beta-barrel protein